MGRLDDSRIALDGYTTRDNALRKTKESKKEHQIEIEIGDTKQPDIFYPQFKTKHWGNECNLSIRLIDDDYAGGEVRKIGEKIEWKRAGRTARLYEKQSENPEENGAFEFEVELASKPVNNVLRFSVQTKGFRFCYQPPMHEEWVPGPGEKVTETQYIGADGRIKASRPEHVVGSYSVFHKTKRNNIEGGKHYRYGKAFHIYRPYATDAKGERTWCKLLISEVDGELSVEVPQTFLDTAMYPVVVDPTFGYIMGLYSTLSIENSYAWTRYTLPVAGTVTKITAQINVSTSDKTATMGMYSGLSLVTGGQTSQETCSAVGVHLKDFTYGTPLALSAGDYEMMITMTSGAGSGIITYESNAAAYSGGAARTYDGGVPATIAGADTNRYFALEATYTASSTDTDDARVAEITGSQDANSARVSETHGIDTGASTRPAEVHGEASANAARDAEAHGEASATNQRGAETHGTDDDQDERGAETTGSIAFISSRSVEMHGTETDNDARTAELTGVFGLNDTRSAEMHGITTDNGQRLAEVTGSIDAHDGRVAAMHGIEITTSDRGANMHGSDATTDARSAEATGVLTAQNERVAEIRGTSLADDSRIAETQGQVLLNDIRDAEIRGVSDSYSTRFAEIAGIATIIGNRTAQITGRTFSDIAPVVLTTAHQPVVLTTAHQPVVLEFKSDRIVL